VLVYTRKMLPSDSPIMSAYFPNNAVAVPAPIRWMPKLRARTKPRGASMTIQISPVRAMARENPKVAAA
jgi:hypothetical protein